MKKSIIIFSILYSFICNGQTAEVYYNRGIAKARLERYRLAVADFSNAIEINPDFSKAYIGRGIAKLDNDKTGACVDWSKAGELGYVDAYDLIAEYCN